MKKRLLFLLTMLITGVFASQLKAQSIGSSDVTSTYLSNPSFESDGNSSAANANLSITGWTQTQSNAGSFNDTQTRDASTANAAQGNSTLVSPSDGDYYLFWRHGWNSSGTTSTFTSAECSLPAGNYTISVDYKMTETYDNTSNKTTSTKLSAINGSTTLAATTATVSTTYNGNDGGHLSSDNWATLSINFTLAETTAVNVEILMTAKGQKRSDFVVDNVRIVYQDAALSSKLAELKGVVKKAKAINSVWGNEDLATLITTVEGKSYTTVEDMNTDIAAMKAIYEDTEKLRVIAISNGDFNTDVNIAADGTNSASFIDPATAEKPYIYPVTGWTPNFKFSSTASQGNTAVYGATIPGVSGNNGTNPPTADMFGNTAGGTLHLSAGWSDQARYKQTVTDLPHGKYIIYYEANNQNPANNNITSNYFGLGDIEANNIQGTSDTFVFSNLKDYPYNEWVASATGITLISHEEEATLNIGLTSTTGGSANGAKLWIDNVTIYHVVSESENLLEDLQADLDIANAANAKQMHQDVKAPLTEAIAAAQALIDAESDDVSAISAARVALAAAMTDATPSVQLYEQIGARLTALQNQLGDIPVADFQAAEVYQNYVNGTVNSVADPTTGTYTSLDEVVPLFQTFVANYWTTNTPAENANLTAFIVNNGFEFGDLTGWTLPNGASGGDGSIVVSTHERGPETASEGTYYFHSWWTGVALQQAISGLPNGQYRLTATVSSNDTNDEHTVFIYADNDNLGVNVPANSMTTWQSPATFDFNVVDGNLTIGVVGGKQDNTFDVNNPWIFYNADNFQLTYLSSSLIKPEIPSGPMNKDVLAALTAADEAYDNSVETYNALVTAINNANASIAIYQTINARLGYLEAQKGSVNITELTTKYNAGDYVNADDVIYAYHALVVAQIGTNPADGTDMTPYIINPMPNFESGFWWNISKPNGGNGPMKGGNVEFEYWNATAANGSFNYSQWIADLPNGTYEVSAEMYNSLNGQEGTFSPAVAVYGSTPSGEQTALVDVEGETFNTYTATKIIVSDGTITIGAKNVNPMTARWTVFKNFRLTFVSADVPADIAAAINDEIAGIDTDKPMNRAEKDAYLAAKAAWEANPSPANYAAVKAAAEVAKKSIANYEIAAADFQEVLNATTRTNIYTYDAYNKYMDQYHRYYEQYKLGGLSDTEAATIKYVFFGNRNWHQPGLPIVQLLGSAWDDRGDDTWNDEIIVDYKPLVREAGNGNNYWINTWSGEGDPVDDGGDGSNFIVPFMEYWVADTEILDDDVFTATVAAATGTRYTVTGVLRARVKGGDAPTGITMNIISEEQVDATLTPTWTRVGDSEYYVANITITGSTDVVDTNQDGLNDLHIQFVVNGTNANWFCFKDLFAERETPLDAATVQEFVQQMRTAVADVENYTLGFETGEYAPYNNAKKLKAAEICHNFIEQIDAAGGNLEHIPNYIMMQQAYSALANSGEWVKNTCEQNAFYWTTDYTADDVEVVTWYNEDGTISTRDYDGYVNQFRTCYPVGWTLGDRADAYNSRIVKFGIDDNNQGDAAHQGTMPGLKSAADGTVLFTKQDTHYGLETGYTLPLKADKTYYLSFIYADHDEEKMPTTNIIIHRKGNATQAVNNLTYPSFAPIAVKGNVNQDRWYYYRGTFTVPETGDYVIEFNKERNDGRSWGEQRQTAIGDLVLVLAPEDDDMDDAIAIDGQTKDFDAADQTPAFDYNPAEVTLTRSFNGNGETGTWNTIMVPFNLDWAETKENFGIEETAYYIGTEDTDIGIKLLFETRRTGLKANQPVMVFYKADNEKLNLTNATMKTRTALASNNEEDQFGTTYNPVVIGKSTNDGIEKDGDSRFVIYDPNGKFDFVGTYQTIRIPKYGVYINPTNEWKQSSNGTTGLQPTRAYFREVAGDGTSTAKLLGFSIDEVPTGIIAIEEDGEMHVTSGNIYTIDGRLVRQNATDLQGLEPGIYVVDGKKYIIK